MMENDGIVGVGFFPHLEMVNAIHAGCYQEPGAPACYRQRQAQGERAPG